MEEMNSGFFLYLHSETLQSVHLSRVSRWPLRHLLSRSTGDHVLVGLCCLCPILKLQNTLTRPPMVPLPRCTTLHFSGVLLPPEVFPRASALLCLDPQFSVLSLLTLQGMKLFQGESEAPN